MPADTTRAAGSAAARSRAFRERARLEADRYGPDPWIFVRELLQNSRDAGATNVTFTVHHDQQHEYVVCRDDGEGMSFEHARRYLFSLYASSKENSKDQAGKFGVGFWSVLRFDPATLTIRSRTANGEAWGLRFDGSLEHASHAAAPEQTGTEITLARPLGDGRLEHRVFDAVKQNARYLHQRVDQDRALLVTINGRTANDEFALPAPSAAFRRGNVRGVVGLGPAPRVELFSRGLRLRAAACLEDLIAPTGRHTSRMRVQFPELPGGLAPQALLESDELEVMLSRSDARDNRALNRLVKLAQRELERLIDRQVAHARPLPWWRGAYEAVAARLRESLILRTVVGSIAGALLAVGLAWMLWGDELAASAADAGPSSTSPAVAVAGPPRSDKPRAYQDLGARYRGPKVDVLSPESAEPVELRYEPEPLRLHFAALTFPKLAEDGSPADNIDTMGPYQGAECTQDCVTVELPVVRGPNPMRIPVPTGHRIVAGSVAVDGQPATLQSMGGGHPALQLPGSGPAQLTYSTVPAPDPTPARTVTAPASVPQRLQRFARQLDPLTVTQRVAATMQRVGELVSYDRSTHVATLHNQAREAGQGFIARTLEIGAGDCDVQNGLLVATLQAASVDARLAVGYVGVRGSALPWLHAWAEYRTEDGVWHVADVSEGAASGLPSAPSSVDPPGPLAAAASPTPTVAADSPQPSTGPSAAPEVSEPPTATTRTEQPAPRSEPPPVAAPTSQHSSVLAGIRKADKQWPWVARSIPLVLLLASAALFVRSRTRRAINLDTDADLSRLLQGVLQQPGAFRHLSSLLCRPLVPLVGDDAISLNRARELAAIGRLYRTRDQPPLATRASRAGAAVLDECSAEGRTVADALGAVDLDRWSALIESTRSDALIDGINAALDSRAEDWGVQISKGVPGGLAVLDLGPLGTKFRGLRGSRLALIDQDTPWLAEAQTVAKHDLTTAVFIAIDHITDRLDIPTDRRARLLATGARAALTDTFAGQG